MSTPAFINDKAAGITPQTSLAITEKLNDAAKSSGRYVHALRYIPATADMLPTGEKALLVSVNFREVSGGDGDVPVTAILCVKDNDNAQEATGLKLCGAPDNADAPTMKLI